LNNLAWKGGSGIAAKQYETFKDWTNTPYQTSTVTEIDEFTRVVDSTSNAYWVSMINRTSDFDKVHDSINIVLYQDDMLLVHECRYKIDENVTTKALYETLKSGVNTITLATIDKFTDIPEDAEIMSLGEWVNPKSNKGSVKITLLPSYKGGLLLDGVNDFGKVTGMPIYKDYTFITEREFLNETFPNQVCLVSKSKVASEIENGGAFIVDNISVNSIINPYSFYKTTSLPGLNTFDRQIVFQSKYKYLDKDIAAGTATDSDTLWLGTFRDNDSRFANVAIYSLMSFPYSMSKFLIERQLKKHKLGTLYPDMVEFRPIVKSNNKWDIIEIWQGDKSLYRPAVNDNKTGIYLKKDSTIGIYVKPKDADEVTKIVVNGTEYTNLKINSNGFYYVTLPITKSPQKINITIDEYIRFEDIVQPYPVLLRFKDENGNEVSWGGKFKVGSTITRIGSAADSNLLPNIYNIFGLLLNGNQVTSSKVIVEKTMVFKVKSAYIFDNNEPKCILSPRLLRIPNSSYKILGYIPDISGHGNHGKINNSAYAGMSGANGYVTNFKNWRYRQNNNSQKLLITDSSVSIKSELSDEWIIWNQADTQKFKIRIIGLPTGGAVRYRYFDADNVQHDLEFDFNGIWECPANVNAGSSSGFSVIGNKALYVGLTIEQIGEYEGAYCLDGVDDSVNIPTTVGGKQVLMKVNWQKSPALLYDQRASGSFAVLTTLEDDAVNPRIAYQARNQNGKTYIDGIENNNIETYTLKDITHNITIANSSLGGIIVPVIGCNTGKSSNFAKMSLYDFMLFDNISTDDKIKELNEYVGIEGNTEWRKTK
jgi:hypothetical protein